MLQCDEVLFREAGFSVKLKLILVMLLKPEAFVNSGAVSYQKHTHTHKKNLSMSVWTSSDTLDGAEADARDEH